MRFGAARGGHAPGHLRNAFTAFVEDGAVPADKFWDEPPTERRLLGLLLNCTDTMPSGLCAQLDPATWGASYAQGARALKRGR